MSSSTTPSAAVRARLPVPPPLTNSSSPPHSATTSRTARRSPAGARGCPAPRPTASPGSRRCAAACRGSVADAGDLALVGHQPDEPGAGPLVDLLGHPPRPRGIVDRRALRPDPRHAPAERPPAGVDVEADAHLRRPAADRALDQVEVRAVVDHQHRRARGRLGGEAGDLADRAAVDRRVGDDEVLEALAGELERLGDGEREHAAEAGIELAGSGAGRRSSAPTSTPPGSAARPPGRASCARCAASRRGRRTRTAASPSAKIES